MLLNNEKIKVEGSLMKKLILLLVTLLVFTSCTQSQEQIKIGSSSGNISNGGLICAFDKGIIYRSESDNWKLYYYDGKEKVKICDDIASYINIIDDTVYYSNYSDGHKLYKVNFDGSNREKITDFHVSNVNAINHEVYFVNMDDNFIIQKLDEKGKEVTIIDSKTNSLVTDGLSLYYIKPTGKDEFSIFMYKLKSKEITQLTQGQYCHYINVIDKQLFYWSVNENVLRTIDLETLENKVLINQGIDHLNSSKNYLFFTNPKVGYNIFRCNLDGTNLEQISKIAKDENNLPSFNPSSIYVAYDRIYYRSYSDEVFADSLNVIDSSLKKEVFDYSSR